MSQNTFRAAVLENINCALSLETLEIPNLQRGQVLVRVSYASVCSSQLFEITGQRGRDPYLPHLLGHEACGEVIQVGEGVERFLAGDKVILTWIKQNGIECLPINFRTTRGRFINAGRVTTFSELTVVSENRLFHAPTTAKEQTLPLLGCAALTGAGMVYGNMRETERVLVVGAGGVGLFSILALLESGIKNIGAIERSTKRASQIKDISSYIKMYQSFTDGNFLKDIERNGNFDLIFEASGSLKALQKSIEFLSKKGRLVFASHPGKGQKIFLDPYELIQGKTIIGSWGGGCEELSLREKVTDLFVERIETINEFISDPFPLSKINSAINYAKDYGDKRVVIRMKE